MPYIHPDQRFVLDSYLNSLLELNLNEGQLNYIITKLLDNFIIENKLCYTNLNSAIGILECAKMELYRRLVAPYEDIKIKENGDVYSKNN